MGKGWIGVDFDGTIALYDGYKGPLHVGAPIPAMVERVKAWLAEGRRVKLMTARVFPNDKTHDELEAVTKVLNEWMDQHLGTRLEMTYIKDHEMYELWDDRAVQVERNTGRRIGDPEPLPREIPSSRASR